MASDWPSSPGVWIRDQQPWPPSDPAARPAFVAKVDARTREVFFGERRLQALAMASFIREGGASRLAMVANNLYGITHSIDAGSTADNPNYPAIRFGGNAHDISVGIRTRYYRVYPDIDTCLKNWLWHLTKSSNFRHFWPLWLDGKDEEYILAMRWVWANKNEADGPSVVALYKSRIAKMEGSTVA